MIRINADTATITIYQHQIPPNLNQVDWCSVYNKLMNDAAALRVALCTLTGAHWTISVAA